MADELKPCPCCGGKAVLKKIYLHFKLPYVLCTVCKVQTDTQDSEEDAVKIWNKRDGKETA